LRAALIVALDGSPHFGAIAIVRSHKVGANQQQNDISAFQVLVQFFFPLDTALEY